MVLHREKLLKVGGEHGDGDHVVAAEPDEPKLPPVKAPELMVYRKKKEWVRENVVKVINHELGSQLNPTALYKKFKGATTNSPWLSSFWPASIPFTSKEVGGTEMLNIVYDKLREKVYEIDVEEYQKVAR
jgi:hypothetical protein